MFVCVSLYMSVRVGSVRRRATGHVWRFLRPIKFGSRRVLCDVYSFVGPCFRLKLTKKIYNNKCRWWGGGGWKTRVVFSCCFNIFSRRVLFLFCYYIFFSLLLFFSHPPTTCTRLYLIIVEKGLPFSLFFFRVIKNKIKGERRKYMLQQWLL